jgi:hypothetical protein
MTDAATLIPERLMVRVAERLRVLGQPVRLRLLEQLQTGSSTPQELRDALGLSQQNEPSWVAWRLLALEPGGVDAHGTHSWQADDAAVFA